MANEDGRDGWGQPPAGYPQAPGQIQGPPLGYPPQAYGPQGPPQGYAPPGYAPQGYGPPQGYGAPPLQQQIVIVQQNSAHTIVQRAPFNHGLHLIISICTCGLWLPVWLILALLH